MMAQEQPNSTMDGIPVAQTSPAYLESVSTAHPWPFSAVAEIVDNAYDPDVQARRMVISHRKINDKDCLQFSDDGSGMNREQLFRMVGFGYSDKSDVEDHKAIGRYGTGFKSGSMRLGADVLVFTREMETHTGSVGMLSRTYLEAIGVHYIIVPIVTWKLAPDGSRADSLDGDPTAARCNLEAICENSIFSTPLELAIELMSTDQRVEGTHGTKIIVYNLRKTAEDEAVLQIDNNNADIVNPAALDHEPLHRRSLRKYLSILYKRPRLCIWLLGKKVQTRLVEKDLFRTEFDTYQPQPSEEGKTGKKELVKVCFGFNRREQDDYGLMIYHKNRLIDAYKKVGPQTRPQTGVGIGVVGVTEADFLTTLNNKQGFTLDKIYSKLLERMGNKLEKYWNDKQEHPSSSVDTVDTWAQCITCNKWRRLGDVPETNVPDDWTCEMNEDEQHNSCLLPEEPLSADEHNIRRQRKQKKHIAEASASKKSNKRRIEEYEAREREERKRQKRQEKRQRQQWDNVRKLNYLAQDLVNVTPSVVADVVEDVHEQLKKVQVQCTRCGADRLVATAEAERPSWLCSDAHFRCTQMLSVMCTVCKRTRYLPADTKLPPDVKWTCDMQGEAARFGSCHDLPEEMPEEKGADKRVQTNDLIDLTRESDTDSNSDAAEEQPTRMDTELASVQNALSTVTNMMTQVGRRIKVEKQHCSAQTDETVEYIQRLEEELEAARRESETNVRQLHEVQQSKTALGERIRQVLTVMFGTQMPDGMMLRDDVEIDYLLRQILNHARNTAASQSTKPEEM